MLAVMQASGVFGAIVSESRQGVSVMASNLSVDKPEYIPKWDRPIRMPKSVPLMHTDPPIAFVGQSCTLQVPFKLSKRISPDTVVKCQLFGGRNNRAVWTGCQVKDSDAPGYVAAELEDGSRLELIADKREGTYTVAVPEKGLGKGDVLTFIVGENGGVNMGVDRLLNKFMVLYTVPEKDADGKLPGHVGTGIATVHRGGVHHAHPGRAGGAFACVCAFRRASG